MDGRGNIYVNGGTDFHPGEGEAPGFVVSLITPDGVVRRVAEGLAFPNGMAVTADNATLIVSESFAGMLTAFDLGRREPVEPARVGPLPGDGIVLDTEGAVWTPGWTETGPACLRVAEGGEVLDTVPLDRAGFACTLGGEDGRTLFMLAADWRMNGRLRGQHRAPDDRTGDRPGPHRARPGRPRRPPPERPAPWREPAFARGYDMRIHRHDDLARRHDELHKRIFRFRGEDLYDIVADHTAAGEPLTSMRMNSLPTETGSTLMEGDLRPGYRCRQRAWQARLDRRDERRCQHVCCLTSALPGGDIHQYLVTTGVIGSAPRPRPRKASPRRKRAPHLA